MRNVPMFAAPDPAPVALSTMLAHHGASKGLYARYRPTRRVPCDECVAVLHEAKGVGSAPLGARIARRAAGTMLRLCGPHAQLWRVKDGLEGRA